MSRPPSYVYTYGRFEFVQYFVTNRTANKWRPKRYTPAGIVVDGRIGAIANEHVRTTVNGTFIAFVSNDTWDFASHWNAICTASDTVRFRGVKFRRYRTCVTPIPHRTRCARTRMSERVTTLSHTNHCRSRRARIRRLFIVVVTFRFKRRVSVRPIPYRRVITVPRNGFHLPARPFIVAKCPTNEHGEPLRKSISVNTFL